MNDMGTHHRGRKPASVFIPWLFFALYLVSICRGDVREFVTEDFFKMIVSGNVSVKGIATPDFFNGILSTVPDGCAGKSFYKHTDFIYAASAFPGFGTTGYDDQKREIAAFFAHVAYETSSLCYMEEINKIDYCNAANTQYPCASGKQYYGRGPLQLTWNYNYGAAGYCLGFDLLNNPEIVTQYDIISWKTALWFWNVHLGSWGTTCHTAIRSRQGFLQTIQIIDGGVECTGLISSVHDRVSLYTKYCSQLGVDPGSNHNTSC